MAQSETSFADRLERARQIHSATLRFVPAFAPADLSLAGAAFSTFLPNADAANLSVSNALIDWKDTVASRIKLLVELKARVLRANARVKSNPSWAIHVPTIKALADKIRGQRTPAPKPPKEEGAAPAVKREQGDQSYADIKNHLDQFTAALKKITNYDLNAPVDITTASLSATASQLQAQSSLIASLCKPSPQPVLPVWPCMMAHQVWVRSSKRSRNPSNRNTATAACNTTRSNRCGFKAKKSPGLLKRRKIFSETEPRAKQASSDQASSPNRHILPLLYSK